LKKPDTSRLTRMILLLRWEGTLGNQRLRDLFDLSQIRASQWLAEFKETYPSWVKFDTLTKTYMAQQSFWLDSGNEAADTLSEYLYLTRSPASPRSTGQTIVSAFHDLSPPNPVIYSTLNQAARHQRQVEIHYRSMRDPKAHLRIIEPHTLVLAGRRWHVRAYSVEQQEYRDYALGRIVKIGQVGAKAVTSAKDDVSWNTMVAVRLMPHPALNEEQRTMIRLEYIKGVASREDTVRAPLVQYYLHEVRAATNVAKQLPPDFQLAVENLQEVKPWLFPE
jgi:predicted DNA-binding transcriptional regulator YafY